MILFCYYVKMSKVIDNLQLIGLTKNEAIVYTTLLKEERGTAYLIAQKSGIKRPTVYIILDELRKKGLVLKIPTPKKQLFIAKSPDELIQQEEDKLNKVKNILPELFGLIKDSKYPLKILVFENEKGIADGLQYKISDLKNSELLCYYAKINKKLGSKASKLYEQYNADLYKNGVKIRAFAPADFLLREYRQKDDAQNRKVIILPLRDFSSDITLEISKIFVRLTFHADKKILIMESEHLVKMMRQIFEIIWSLMDHKTAKV